MSKNIPRSPVLAKIAMNIATYVACGSLYTAPPTKSMSSLAAKTLEGEKQPTFRWKRTRRQAFLKVVSTQNQRKKCLETLLCAVAMLI